MWKCTLRAYGPVIYCVINSSFFLPRYSFQWVFDIHNMTQKMDPTLRWRSWLVWLPVKKLHTRNDGLPNLFLPGSRNQKVSLPFLVSKNLAWHRYHAIYLRRPHEIFECPAVPEQECVSPSVLFVRPTYLSSSELFLVKLSMRSIRLNFSRHLMPG